MPKAAAGPKLRLFGPDAKHGAKRKASLKNYAWYIVWQENGVRQERATGAGLRETAEAEEYFENFLTRRRESTRPASGYHPHQVTVGRLLHWYVTEEAPKTATHERICHAVDAMMPFWNDVLLSEVAAKKCGDYVKWRSKQATKNSRSAVDAWERRKVKAEARPAPFDEPEPEVKTVALRTVRTELEYLRGAIGYCYAEGYITQTAPVKLPEKGEPRSVWLERSEFARMLLAAREKIAKRPDARRHLIVYLLVGVYQPARMTAILQLPLIQPIDGGAWLDAKNGRIDFGPGTGNKKRPQHVPIHPRLRVYIRAALARGQRFLVEYSGTRSNDKFRRTAKVALKSIRRSFNSCVARAGITKRVTPHTLRHTGVTWLKAAGMESWQVGGYAGMTKETVDTIYAHHHPDHMKDVVLALTRGRRS